MRRQLIFSVLLVTLLVAGCASDPTASPEYLELEEKLATTESDLAEQSASFEAVEADLQAAQSEVADLGSQMGELETQVGDLEEENGAIAQEAASLEDILDEWILFSGSPNDEPFVWSQEYYDTFVLTCGIDGTTTEACGCIADTIENRVPLMDLLLFTELVQAAELGLVDVNPTTGFPEDMPPDVIPAILEAYLGCV